MYVKTREQVLYVLPFCLAQIGCNIPSPKPSSITLKLANATTFESLVFEVWHAGLFKHPIPLFIAPNYNTITCLPSAISHVEPKEGRVFKPYH